MGREFTPGVRYFSQEQLNRMIEDNLRCDLEAYHLLRCCSDKKDLREWNAWRQEHPAFPVYLQGVDCMGFFLREADFAGGHYELALFNMADCGLAGFRDAFCQGAEFTDANCENVEFSEAHCEGARFLWSRCKGASFSLAHCEEADFSWAHCEKTNFLQAYCQGARFIGSDCNNAAFKETHCEGASFAQADCSGADLHGAFCQGANFSIAKCQKTCFWGADCRGVNFFFAHCQEADFSNSYLDTLTNFSGCAIDDGTRFFNASLGAPMMEPGTRHKLEHNIRRVLWAGWYLQQYATLRRSACGLLKGIVPGSPLWSTVKKLRRATYIIATLPVQAVRLFWHISDYGYSTVRVLKWFFSLILAFALLYTVCPFLLNIRGNAIELNGFSQWAAHFFQMLAFATSTMVTLGFSEINVAIDPVTNRASFSGMIAVTSNLMAGYFMLAVLVTRLAILFQTLGPGYVAVRKKDRPKMKR